jgi:hypothetical protein
VPQFEGCSVSRSTSSECRPREAVRNRPTAQKGVDLGKEWRLRATSSDKERKILFNPTAQAVLGRG